VARELRECLKRALDAVVDAAAPDRPALAPEGPALAPEGPALADAPVLPAGQASPTGTAPAGL
jgi:hypothetical protein